MDSDAPVTVRYWASAKAAAGVPAEEVACVGGISLSALLEVVVARHADRPRFAEVVACCSVLVGDRPVGAAEPADVLVGPGETVELLPPFAGG